MNPVGSHAPHDAAALHVSGQARYVDDIPASGSTLHLAFGYAPIAHADLDSIDLDDVRSSDDVVAVVDSSGLPGKNDVSPSGDGEPLLAVGKVSFFGQPVFVVAARSHLAARKAARKAKFSFTGLPALLTIEDALGAESRLEAPLTYQRGDPDQAIADATYRVTGAIDIGGQEHFYLEGQVALVIPLEDGDMLVYSSTQHPTEVQHKVADTVGVSMHAVRVEVRRMGGGFGGKESQANSAACACAAMAKITAMPCKMRLDRDDDMLMTGKRHDARIEYKAGFDESGKLHGVVFNQYIRCGWSRDLSLAVADRAMLHADNAYYIPTMRVTSDRLRTNTQSATAFRGFGGPQGMLGIERVVDHVAWELGVEPSVIRRRNYYPPEGSRIARRTHYDMVVDDCVIEEITSELVRTSDYERRRAGVVDWNDNNRVLKKGIALTPVKFGISFTLTHLNQAGALVHVYLDGSIRINHGGTEMGQGLLIKVAQVAASTFGQPLEAVKITEANTATVPNTSATAASSGSDLNGMAVKRASDTILERLIGIVSRMHQCQPDEVVFQGGVFKVGGEAYEFKDVVKMAYVNRVSLSATGHYSTPKVNWDRMKGKGRPFHYFAYGASVSEVMIDSLTGEYRILRTDILHDVGKSLNPAIDLGQIEGGFVQGAGWLTVEELVWDDQGKLLTHAPSTYKIPACSDRPAVFNVSLWERGFNSEETIYRSKAVGEPPLMHGISAFLALSDAVAACGDGSVYPDLDAPATPERILAAVQRQTGKANEL